jgi:hypothetical protein
MKPEKDPLKAIFNALPEQSEPIDLDRQDKALERFRRERLHEFVEEERDHFVASWVPYVDVRSAKKSHVKKTKTKRKPKDRVPRP